MQLTSDTMFTCSREFIDGEGDSVNHEDRLADRDVAVIEVFDRHHVENE